MKTVLMLVVGILGLAWPVQANVMFDDFESGADSWWTSGDATATVESGVGVGGSNGLHVNMSHASSGTGNVWSHVVASINQDWSPYVAIQLQYRSVQGGTWWTWVNLYQAAGDFYEPSDNQWYTITLDISTLSRNPVTEFHFYTNSDLWPWGGSNDVYFDNIELVTPSLQGTVALQGYLGDNTTLGVNFQLTPVGGGQTITRSIFLNADGSFLLDNITPGTYTVAVKNNASLKTVLNNVSINANPTVLANPIVLTGADCNGDNAVSFEDFSILQNAYGQSGGAAGPLSAAVAATGGCGSLGVLLLTGMGLALCLLKFRRDEE